MATAETKRGHAVVLGRGMAGIVAAAVLARHYDQVTIVEQDDVADRAGARRGVPQGAHPHAITCRGLRGLEDLMPGTHARILDAGGIDVRAEDLRWRGSYGWHVPIEDPTLTFRGVSATRPLLEASAAAGLAVLPTISVLDSATVTGLRWDRDRVVGLTFSRHGQPDSLGADLVVDATGRGGNAARWLVAGGYAPPAETAIDPHVGYATVRIRAPRLALGGAKVLLLFPPADCPRRAALVAQVENDEWLVTLSGGGRSNHPPREPQSFKAFAQSVGDPSLDELLNSAEPSTDIIGHHGSVNQRSYWERLARHPQGYLAFGDRFCLVNPQFGQGMTLAVLYAEQLDQLLGEGRPDPGLPRLAYRRFAAVAEPAWLAATTVDLSYPETTGVRTRAARMQARYLARVDAAACTSPAVGRTLLAVTQMLAPPRTMFAPHVLLGAARVRRAMSPAEPSTTGPALLERTRP